jgi:acetyl esterase/lipase
MVQHSEVARTESSRRVTMLAVLVMFTVSVFAAAIGIPADAAVHTTPLVSGVAYGPLPEQRLDVHLPADGTGPFPVLIYLHAGGWIAGDRTVIPDFIAAQVERGIALVSVDYRLVTTAADGTFRNSFPVPDTDVDRAIRFVKAHAGTWNLDPDHVLLAGASAGGHLAALAAAAPGAFVARTLPADLDAVSPRVQGVLDFVGISDFTTFGDAGGWAPGLMTAFLDCPVTQVDRCDPTEVTAATVATHLDADAPPAFLAYGATDGLVVAATQGAPLAAAWTHARADQDPTWHHGVEYQRATSGHNLDSTSLDVDAMQTWIADVLLHRAPAVAVATRRAN